MKQRRVTSGLYLATSLLMIASAFTIFWGSIYAIVAIGGALMVIIASQVITETHGVTDGILEVFAIVAMVLSLMPQS